MASSTASLTKFSEAISSSPSCCRRVSLSMAAAICGSDSNRGWYIAPVFEVMRRFRFLIRLVYVRPQDFHISLRPFRRHKSELRVPLMGVERRQVPSPQALQRRVLQDALHQALAEPASPMRFENEHVSDVSVGSEVA